VPTVGNYRNGNRYICNCCTCSCGILRGLAEFAAPTAIARSAFRATVDADQCIGCETCVERCQFGALSVPEDLCEVDWLRCVGCGLCVPVCPTEALRLERRSESETVSVPVDEDEWMAQRAEARGISLQEIM